MAEIKFYGNIIGFNGDPPLIDHTAGSGIGFFGAGFGVSVPVQSQQSTTYITNSSGTVAGAPLRNTALVSSGTSTVQGTVKVEGGAVYNLSNLPNNLCPLNLRFTHSTAVAVKNCKVRIFDRNNIEKQASGVSTWLYEVRHPSINPLVGNLQHRKSTENSWFKFDPSLPMPDMPLTESPGVSGKNTITGETNQSTLGWETTEGASHLSTRHDWYLAMSSQPESPGAKNNYGLYFTLEYL